ncbi:hypothetical protein EGW08_006893 [Elysia chlorotica]|uniref:Uncharacterized protein n=1 Tax=Elysia chlorotica TaxID=188477 RepID=A0A3S1BCV2_ELYCH|nr:hypothetical protein EGW08_006893 [Elysia chlorotica]
MNTLAVSDIYITRHTEQRLVAAAGAGDISTVRKLLRKNVPTSVLDEYGRTALHVASLDHHTETIKQLVLGGAALDAENCNRIAPIGLTRYDTDAWDVLNDARHGDMPELDEVLEVPDVPDYALPDGAEGKKGKKKKSGKKGKKGKGKKGKKSGGKKKGKKKKKK